MPQPNSLPTRIEAAQEILRVALEQFSEVGYAGASLQHIADLAGYSKSSVLYHYASKEALLERALTPAVERLDTLLGNSVDRIASPELREAFVVEFIDFLLEYRLQAHLIINQGQSLAGIAIVDRAQGSITRLSETFMTELPSTHQRIRLGIALGGAAYVLAAAPLGIDETDSMAEIRDALVAIVSELVTPLSDSIVRDDRSHAASLTQSVN
jgi:TetR/AcrR family transcriptional regulator